MIKEGKHLIYYSNEFIKFPCNTDETLVGLRSIYIGPG